MHKIIICSLVLAVAGCGDDSITQVRNQKTGGIWNGTFTAMDPDTQEPVTSEFLAISTDSGMLQAAILFPDVNSTVLSVQMSATGSMFTATGSAFAYQGSSFADGSTVTTIVLEGDLMEREGLSGTWSAASGESGSFILDYEATLHERTTTLDQIVGVWEYQNRQADLLGTITIDEDGQLFGTSTLGCINLGNVSVPDRSFNVYEMSINVSNCGEEDGDYFGLGYWGLGPDETGPTEIVPAIVSSDKWGVPVVLVR